MSRDVKVKVLPGNSHIVPLYVVFSEGKMDSTQNRVWAYVWAELFRKFPDNTPEGIKLDWLEDNYVVVPEVSGEEVLGYVSQRRKALQELGNPKHML